MQTTENYRERYAPMSDGELAELVSDGLDSLKDEARPAFENELRKRGLTVATLRQQYPPEQIPKTRGKSSDGYLRAGWFALKEFRLAQKAQHWPIVTGMVQDSFHTEPVYKGVMRAEIVYDYSVNSRKYEGKTIRDFVLTGAAERMVEQHDIGDQVEVRFDPEDPAKSYVPSGIGYLGSAVTGTLGLLIWALVAAIVIGLMDRHAAP
jgi:Protein of unknown function (DUF3592)